MLSVAAVRSFNCLAGYPVGLQTEFTGVALLRSALCLSLVYSSTYVFRGGLLRRLALAIYQVNKTSGRLLVAEQCRVHG